MKKKISEAWYDTVIDKAGKYRARDIVVDIFVNPTAKEWEKEIVYGGRGYIDKAGNFYIEGLTEDDKEFLDPSIGTRIIHVSLLKLLGKIVPKQLLVGDDFSELENLEKADRLGVCVQRKGSSNRVFLSESYYEDDVEENEELIEEVLDKARVLNPKLKFYCKVIDN